MVHFGGNIITLEIVEITLHFLSLRKYSVLVDRLHKVLQQVHYTNDEIVKENCVTYCSVLLKFSKSTFDLHRK